MLINNKSGLVISISIIESAVVLFEQYKKAISNREISDEQISILKSELPAIVAFGYAAANANNSTTAEEKLIINQEISRLLPENSEKIAVKELRNKLNELSINAGSITLSEALQYVNPKNEKQIRKKIKEFADEIINSDNRIDEKEKVFLDRLDLFIKNGKEKALIKIVEAENNDSFECFYLTQQKNFKPNVKTAKVVSIDEISFLNKNKLTMNSYYIVHPMDNKQLFNILEIDQIDKLLVAEWQSLARKLGAKEFKCELRKEIESEIEKNISVGIKGKIPEIPANGELSSNYNGYEKDTEKKFQQYNAEWNGSECILTKEELYDELCWLKTDTQARELIKSMTSNNKLKSIKINSSFSSFKNSNSSLDINATLNIIDQIDVSLKSKISSNIKKSQEYTQLMEIKF